MSTAVSSAPSLALIRPAPDAWLPALSAPSPSADQQAFRAQLGLDPSRPVVMSGHQAGVWHPGILAKWLAMLEAARRTGAQAAWLVVDTDTNDPSAIRFPTRDAAGTLHARTWPSLPGLSVQGGRLTGHIVTGRVPARAPAPIPAEAAQGATADVSTGLALIRDTLQAHAGAPSVAHQTALACRDLIAARIGISEPVTILTASSLSRTDAFARVLQRIAADPQGATRAYADAVRTTGVAAADADAVPLWAITGSSRGPVDPAAVDPKTPERYAPRALLLTGLLRWLGSDVFIHGTGGAGADGQSGYDAVTVEWLRAWLSATLAPAAMVTATLRLNIPATEPTPSPEAIRHAQWLAHAARHRPALLDDAEGQARRDQLLATLQSLRHKKDPASRRLKLDTYRALHATLGASRTANAPRLDRLRTEALAAAARRTQAEILADRTWAFPLYAPAQLAALHEQIRIALGA